MSNKVLFLDRDGVVNVDHGYLYKSEDFEFIDGLFTGCLAFQRAGYQIIIITNQSGIGRGYYTEHDFTQLSDWMIGQFNAHGVDILDVFFCPHHPEKANPPYKINCECRKPAPGMLLQAQKKHNVSLQDSIMVGDKGSDMQAAVRAGVGRKFLVTSGQTINDTDIALADNVYPNLAQLAKALCYL